jgi:alcohol dehydrogenase (cytochrome c)
VSCPSYFGGKNQPSGAYSPITHAMYMPMNNTCADVTMSVEQAAVSDGYAINVKLRHVPDVDPAAAAIGRLDAISASTGKTLWTFEQRAPMYGSVLTTASNLVFAGDHVGRFRAFDAATGKVLWETALGVPISGRPMTYSVGGRQYLAVGVGGFSSHATGILGLTPELTTETGNNRLLVFALPER